MQSRRRFIRKLTAISGAALGSKALFTPALAVSEATVQTLGSGELWSLTDGRLSLPLSLVVPDTIDSSERQAFLQQHQMVADSLTPDCNVTLWRQDNRVVLFDAGAGVQFSGGGGQLTDSLAAAGIAPEEVTDVIFTHAHPDHLWGVLDDFDDLAFPEAHYHVPEAEWNYWMDTHTLDRTPDERKSFAVGAKNRLSRLSERVSLFTGGDEVLPTIEAVDTHGHTPGHTSFVLHSGSDSIMVIGDALTNAALSFERPRWPSGTDQDPVKAVDTRLALLSRLAGEKTMLAGFHLPAPGIGFVERNNHGYRFIASV